MTRSLRLAACAGAIVVSSLAAAGCRIPVGYDVAPGRAPRCADGVCVEVVAFRSHHLYVGAWIEAPPGTLLVNAHLLPDETPPCQGHMPIEWVTLDDETYRHGPLDVGGKHGLVLGFPWNAWAGHSGYWKAMFADLELSNAGQVRCVRTRLANAEGKEAVGR